MSYRLRGFGDASTILATMPILPATACAANQTYIAPGTAFTSGSMAGKITSTGACQDTVAAAKTCFSLLGGLWAGSDSSECLGPATQNTWIVAALALGALWMFSGGLQRRVKGK